MAAGTPDRFGAGARAVALTVALAFALNVIAMKVVVGSSAPLTAVALRMAAVFALCLPWLRRVPGRTAALAGYGVLNGGLFLVTMNVALAMAHNVGALAIAGQLSIPFSLLLGAAVFGERLTRRQAGGVALAFAGVVMLVFDPAILGEIAALFVMALASFFWAAGTLVQRRLGGVPVPTIQAWNGLMGMVLLGPPALLLEPGAAARLAGAGTEAIGWFAFSVIGATIAGQGTLAWLLGRHPLSRVMPLMLASPIMATAASSLYFRSPITPAMIGGGLVALAGVAIITIGPA